MRTFRTLTCQSPDVEMTIKNLKDTLGDFFHIHVPKPRAIILEDSEAGSESDSSSDL